MDEESKVICSVLMKELTTNFRDISVAVHQLTEVIHEHSLKIDLIRVELDTTITSTNKLNIAIRDGNGSSLMTRMVVLEEHLKHYGENQAKIAREVTIRAEQEVAREQAKKQFRWAIMIAIVSGVLGMLQGAWALLQHK